MKYYNYDPATFVYTTSAEADVDPLVPGNFLIPAFSTLTEPPIANANEVAIFVNNDWQVVPDYRNVTYWLPDGKKYTITQANVLPPSTASHEPPPLSIAEIANNKINYINTTFTDAISCGYTCLNGIKMDANDTDIAKLDNGYRLAQRLNLTAMNICDYDNKVHADIPLSMVSQMVGELGSNYSAKLAQKWSYREEVNNILQRTQLILTNPEYMSDDDARVAIDAVPTIQ